MEPVRAVVRALQLLRVMDESREFSLRELQDRTGLPKPTIFRLLATLESEGCIAADHATGRYRLASGIRQITRGFTERSAIVEIATPIIHEVTQTIKWPLAIGILEGTEIVIRASTMPASPLAVETTTVGKRHSLISSAVGVAYLAFCNITERRVLLDALRAAGEGAGSSVQRRLGTTRLAGYAVRLPRRKGESGTIALPIAHRDRVLGLLSMTTFGTLMTNATISSHLPILKKTAAHIARAYAAQAEAS